MESGLYTLSELHEKMRSMVDDNTPVYHERYLKESLQKYYGNSILFSNQERRKDVAGFSSCVSEIIQDHYRSTRDNVEDQKRAIIRTAASLIANDIKCLKDEFPSVKEMTSHYQLPESLELLLTILIPHSSIRRNVMGQNIISSLRPRSSKLSFSAWNEFIH